VSRHQPLWSILIALISGVACACAALSAPQKKPERAAPPPATAPADTVKLTITVKDLRNRKGQLVFGVFKSADGFPTVERKSVNWQVKDVTGKTVTFTADLPPGKYAASVLHDENRSGDMDRNIANIPTEGYGVTNNPKPAFRAATFKEATFTLPPEGASLTISVQYF
jgi:uncharacterized protein (DUF2141 family)